MSTVILLLAVALTLHVLTPVQDAFTHIVIPIALSAIAVVLAIAVDHERNAEWMRNAERKER